MPLAHGNPPIGKLQICPKIHCYKSSSLQNAHQPQGTEEGSGFAVHAYNLGPLKRNGTQGSLMAIQASCSSLWPARKGCRFPYGLKLGLYG